MDFFSIRPLKRLLVFLSRFFAARAVCRAPSRVRRGRRAGSSDPLRLLSLRSFVSILLFGGLGYEDHLRLRAPVALHHRLRPPGRPRRQHAAPRRAKTTIPRTTSNAPARTTTGSRLAVAGFGADDIAVTAEQNALTIEGRKPEEAAGEYLYRGIAARPFRRVFNLADYVQVKQASFRDGLLIIDLVREVPEADEAAPDPDRKRRLSRLADRAEEGGLTPDRGSTAERGARSAAALLAHATKEKNHGSS